MSENSLVIFTRASQMLAQADTIQKAHELKDLALTAAEWAKRKGMGEEAIQYARSYALEAERKMGEMLRATERHPPGPDRLRRVTDPPPTLADLGVTKRESAEAQRLADLPVEVFEEVRAGKKTRTAAKREARRDAVTRTVQELPAAKYRVLYADPPWEYGNGLADGYGPTRFHYPPLSIADLCALPVAELAEENAVLFLWVTSPQLAECWPVIKAWGFTYKASFVWDKIKHNFGHYNSVRHELLLVCTRGSCLPDEAKLHDSVVSIERAGHSEKPAAFRRMIEGMYQHGKCLELFARTEAAGRWETWGNERTRAG
jgi:N6-adenosine-specific RNA methylase IME4